VDRRLPLALIVGGFVLAGLAVAWATLWRDAPETQALTIEAPAPGEVRAEYLPDGEPVFFIGHDDGSGQLLSPFSTHVPQGLGKLTWWCPTARGFEDPFHGSRWDEYGVKMAGPAPSGLPTWQLAAAEDGGLALGELLDPPGLDAPVHGPPTEERTWCNGLEDPVTYPSFADWTVWDSPSAAVEEAPDEWILLEGGLSADPATGQVLLCSLAGCEDSAIAATVQRLPPGGDFPVVPVTQYFIARVQDGALVNLTRVIRLPGD